MLKANLLSVCLTTAGLEWVRNLLLFSNRYVKNNSTDYDNSQSN